MLITTATLRALRTSFSDIFNQAYQQAPSHAEKIATIVRSTSRSQTYGWMGASTRFREWVGDRVLQNLQVHDYQIVNKTFENTVAIPREDVEDDNIALYRPVIEQLAADARLHADELLFGLLKNGFTQLCYDQKPFFSALHPVGSATASNFQTGTAAPWFLLDTSQALKPLILQKRRDYAFVAKDNPEDEAAFLQNVFVYGADGRLNAGYGLWQCAFGSKADLTAANYEQAYAAMLALKDPAGRPVGVRPTLLVVPPSLRAAASALVNAQTLANGATNTNYGSAELLVTSWVA